MRIVIDIDSEVYNFIKNRGHIPYAVNIANEIANAIVLPEGHGDLIDRNCFANRYESCGNEYCEHPDECEGCNSRIIDKYDVDNIPVIIPADKGGKLI